MRPSTDVCCWQVSRRYRRDLCLLTLSRKCSPVTCGLHGLKESPNCDSPVYCLFFTHPYETTIKTTMAQQKSVKQRNAKNRTNDEQQQQMNGPNNNYSNTRHSSKQSRAGTTTSSSSSWKQSVFQGLALSVVFFFLASYLITDTWLWGYKGKYTNMHYWFPVWITSTYLRGSCIELVDCE